ncbi:MAG TPA: hypothetical protein VHX86_16440 [Tepidisphaeraceae bacterium]|jgi:hypothetical protein|nr:hypothetical protein [Tepidisphaeraceae bacterium]
MMEESELRSRILNRLGLRIEPRMCKYVLQKAGNSAQPLAVIGGDARTGVPRTEIIEPRAVLK